MHIKPLLIWAGVSLILWAALIHGAIKIWELVA